MNRIIIVGAIQPHHLGAVFNNAAQTLDLESNLINVKLASSDSRLLRAFFWRLFDHRPVYLQQFSNNLVQICESFRPDCLLVTGIAPPTAATLKKIKDMGTVCVNFLSDDPWNPANSAQWFLRALREYDVVFNPRRANFHQLEQIVPKVVYLPFAYSPNLHFYELPNPDVQEKYECDVLFYGGADADRIPYIETLIDAGLNIHLYGGYWERFAKTRPCSKGMAGPQALRWAVSSAKTTLCLVRQANRDGHVMRTFEAPAMGACMIVEDTPGHREILGDNGEAVVYFSTPDELVEQAKMLLANANKRSSLRQNAIKKITSENNTYTDRLQKIIQETKVLY